MNNITSVKKANDSPKTPGGISKSYLTPIRRVGLSRNFRKGGRSPFISPLSAQNSPIDTNKPDTECRKRKKISDDDENKQSIEISLSNESVTSPISCNTQIAADINGTPSRNVLVKKKSKTLVLTKDCNEEPITKSEEPVVHNSKSDCDTDKISKSSPKSSSVKVSKLSRSNSKSNNKVNPLPLKVEVKEQTKDEICTSKDIKHDTNSVKTDNKSPNNLTKECVVVIQKKLLNSINKNNSKLQPINTNPISQVLFDSDSEDIPLSNLNKQRLGINNKTEVPDKEDDFEESKVYVKKLVDKSTSVSELKPKIKEKKALKTKITKPPLKIETTPSSQSSNSYEDDDDDDFQFDKKKTIIIKKCYEKIAKPLKAKSTGSITQADINEMKERIEKKKNLLLAKALTNETSELRDLIKKWQKGCQNALTELVELMKTKMPDKENMDYAEILQVLKIPPNLVGYDSENDCFVTPDDATIILSALNV